VNPLRRLYDRLRYGPLVAVAPSEHANGQYTAYPGSLPSYQSCEITPSDRVGVTSITTPNGTPLVTMTLREGRVVGGVSLSPANARAFAAAILNAADLLEGTTPLSFFVPPRDTTGRGDAGVSV
jgi:hypothetical protein